MPLFRPHRRRAGLLLAALLMTGIAPAEGATLIVTTTNDSCSPWILNGRCLRSAIEYANLFEDADRIFFDIPGNPDHYQRILLQSALAIANPLEIDGYTQPGASPNTSTTGMNAQVRVILDASAVLRGEPAIEVGATADIRGLSIIDAEGPAIYLRRWAAESRVRGNFIGTEPSGFAAPNTGGVLADCEFCVFGGFDPADRNLISANAEYGIRSNGIRNVIIGNLIGTDSLGAPTLGNGIGVHVGVGPTRIGDFGVPMPNVIAGNHCGGVSVAGTDTVDVAVGSLVFANDAEAAGCRSIALEGTDHVNDAGDADVGPNGALNHPEILSVRERGGDLVVEGRINSAPSTEYRVELFANFSETACGGAGARGEGEAALAGFIITTPPGSGVETFTWRAPLAGLGIRSVAATASVGVPEVAAFSTSGFSPCAFVSEDDGLFTDGFEARSAAPAEGILTLD
jgi:trimeric autotransporter adhesin